MKAWKEIADKCQIVANNFETIIMKIAKGSIYLCHIIIVTIAVVIFSLIFDFINDFDDTARSVTICRIMIGVINGLTANFNGSSDELYRCFNIYGRCKHHY